MNHRDTEDTESKKIIVFYPRRALMVLVALVVGYIFCGGFTIHLSPQSPVAELQTARALWDEQQLTDYEMRVVFGGAWYCCNGFTFTVKNNQVLNIDESIDFNNYVSSERLTEWYGQSRYSKFFPLSVENYTIDQLFDFAEQKLKDEPAPAPIDWCENFDTSRQRYTATFDEESGYISSLWYGNCVPKYEWGLGLMCPVMADCGIGISISELQPLSYR